LFQKEDSYDDTHYLNIRHFSKDEKKEMKKILKDGKKLHHYVAGMIEKGVK
jgi:CBS domain-containing protein